MTQQTYTDKDYMYGRVTLPPWAYHDPITQYPYVYTGKVTVTGSTTALLDVPIEPDAYFLVEGISIIPSFTGSYENVRVQIFDTSTNKFWSNATVNLRDIAGKGDSPKYLTDARLVFPSATLRLSIVNSGSTATFYVAFHGRKIYNLTPPQASFLLKRQWYQYLVAVPAINAGIVNTPTTLNIFNESDFLNKKIYSTDIIQFVINTATAGTESGEVLMQLKNGSSDKNFFANSLPVRLVAGSQYCAYAAGGASFTNAEGFTLKKPIFLPKTSSVLCYFTNLSATNLPLGATVALEGCQVFQ